MPSSNINLQDLVNPNKNSVHIGTSSNDVQAGQSNFADGALTTPGTSITSASSGLKTGKGANVSLSRDTNTGDSPPPVP